MKIDRLLGILTTLLRQEKVTAPALAEKFEVSRRTISRDIQDLCMAGIPIVAEQGRGGGLSIAPGYKLDKQLLTEGELQAILIGLRGIDSVSKAPHRAALEEKLARGPGGMIPGEYILIDLASHYKDSLTEKIALLETAIREHRTVSFRYYSEKGVAPRTAEPYYVVFQWSDWYLLAFCTDRQDFRMFKLPRLWELRMEDALFEPRDIPPQRLEFDRAWEENYRLEALFDPQVTYRLVEEYGPRSFVPQEDGKLYFSRDFTFYSSMLSWVLSFGNAAEVLSPLELREDLAELGRNFLSKYGKQDI